MNDLEEGVPARTRSDQLLDVELLLTARAPPAPANVHDVQPGALQPRATGAFVEAKPNRVRNHPGELPDLDGHREHLAFGHGVADGLHDALADGQLVHEAVLRVPTSAGNRGRADLPHPCHLLDGLLASEPLMAPRKRPPASKRKAPSRSSRRSPGSAPSSKKSPSESSTTLPVDVQPGAIDETLRKVSDTLRQWANAGR